MVRPLLCCLQMLLVVSFVLPGCKWPSLRPPAPSCHDPLVGQAAPEIAGEDIDGIPMRLSDYRGQVVLLDFWGHW